MDKKVLEKIIKDRIEIEEYVKYVGAFLLKNHQGLILGQASYQDLNRVSDFEFEVDDLDGMVHYNVPNNSHGHGPCFPVPTSKLENPFKPQYHNQGMQMLVDKGLVVPEKKLGYPKITEFKDDLLKRDRLTLRDLKLGEYYALINHTMFEDSLPGVDILRIGKIEDFSRGYIVPGPNEYLLSTSIQGAPLSKRRNGWYSFEFVYVKDKNESGCHEQKVGDVYSFRYNCYNRIEENRGNIWVNQYCPQIKEKFIPVTKDDLMFLQSLAKINKIDLIDYFTPKLLKMSESLKNEQSR